MSSPAASPGPAVPGDDAAHQVRALLDRHDLAGKPCAVAYLSFTDPESSIAAYDENDRLETLIGFLALPLQGGALLSAIAAIDENGPRLVDNFRRAFPADAQRLAAFEAGVDLGETAAPGWLTAASSLLLGLTEDDVFWALQPSDDVVGLDTFVIEVAGRYVLDGRRLLRSLMSYRIGGASEVVLARSVFTSLGRFVADAVGRLLRDWRAEAIVCAGDLFAANAILLESARRGLGHLGPPVVDPRSVTRPAPAPPRAEAPGPRPVPVLLTARPSPGP